MADYKKRLQVPVAPETERALRLYAEAYGTTVPKATADILNNAAPALVELAQAVAEAKRAPSKGIRDMAAQYRKLNQEADQLLLDMSPKATGKKRKKAS
jgi:hypothetical protein